MICDVPLWRWRFLHTQPFPIPLCEMMVLLFMLRMSCASECGAMGDRRWLYADSALRVCGHRCRLGRGRAGAPVPSRRVQAATGQPASRPRARRARPRPRRRAPCPVRRRARTKGGPESQSASPFSSSSCDHLVGSSPHTADGSRDRPAVVMCVPSQGLSQGPLTQARLPPWVTCLLRSAHSSSPSALTQTRRAPCRSAVAAVATRQCRAQRPALH